MRLQRPWPGLDISQVSGESPRLRLPLREWNSAGLLARIGNSIAVGQGRIPSPADASRWCEVPLSRLSGQQEVLGCQRVQIGVSKIDNIVCVSKNDHIVTELKAVMID
jgi:hypothetical protein